MPARAIDARSRGAFLLLIALQAAHSVEEYSFALYEVLAPARLVSRIVPGDPSLGFALVNAALVAFGAWCYLARVRVGHPSARSWAWLWVLIELGNGIVHPLLAIAAGGYFPGVATAPALGAVAGYLGVRLWSSAEPRRTGA
jgi:hypothetical protein